MNLFSRIVAAADSYDAMISGRVYVKTRISPDEALRRLLAGSRSRYDPLVLRAFVHVLGMFPVGTFVRLSTGEIGIISRNDSSDLFRPHVRILREPDGSQAADRVIKLTATDPQTGMHVSYISEVLSPESVNLSVREALDLPDPIPSTAAEVPAAD